MGIIKAAINAVGGALADSWLEAIQSGGMGENTVFCPGQIISGGRSQNRKGNENIISNGSKILVKDNEFMIVVDNGRIVEYTAEPGPYIVQQSSAPSLFNGQFGDSLKEAFERVKFAGIPSNQQHVFFINLKEIKNIKFGTANPVQYFDNYYRAQLFVRLHGSYSIKITNPFKFYQEVIPNENVDNNEPLKFEPPFIQQYNEEFVNALSVAFNNYSSEGVPITSITSQTMKLAQYMADALDEDWDEARGFQVHKVAVGVPAFDEKSTELMAARDKGETFRDREVRDAYNATNISEGLKAAGSNANGAMAGFMGMGIGMNAVGGMGGLTGSANYGNPQQPLTPQQAAQQAMGGYQQPQQPQQAQPQQQSDDSWTCECGAVNTGKFCPECGSKKPEAPKKKFCSECGTELAPGAKFCPECGTKA